MYILEKLFSLSGKTVLVTGGYKGIGRTLAETYAEAGANVAVVARNDAGCREAAEDIFRKFGVKTMGMRLDVTDPAMTERVVQDVLDEFGEIDVLVNSAGVPGSEKPVLKMSYQEMDEVMNINFMGTFIVSKVVVQAMVRQQGGRIINVSSNLGKMAARNMAGYCASKAAIIQLTRVMALELMRDNIQVNALCPGYILTEFNADFFASEAGKNLIRKKLPLNRIGTLDELKSTALYLATCPAFMTGSELYIDGGHSISN